MKYTTAAKKTVEFMRSRRFFDFGLIYLIFALFILAGIYAVLLLYHSSQIFMNLSSVLVKSNNSALVKQSLPILLTFSFITIYILVSLFVLWIFRQGALIGFIYKKRFDFKRFLHSFLFTLISAAFVTIIAFLLSRIFPISIYQDPTKMGFLSLFGFFVLALFFNSHFYFVAYIDSLKEKFRRFGLYYFKTLFYMIIPLAVELTLVYLLRFIKIFWIDIVIFLLIDIFFVIFNSYLGLELMSRKKKVKE